MDDALPEVLARGVRAVWSMGRVGSHSVRDALRARGVDAFVVHSACLSNAHMTPRLGEKVYDFAADPDGVGGERLEWCRRARNGDVAAVVPVRNPVERACSAWRYFHHGRGRIEEYDHSVLETWWGQQLERCLGEPMPSFDKERGRMEWKGLTLVRIDTLALERKVTTRGDKPLMTEAFADMLRGCRTARWFFTEREIEEALSACRQRA